jgi:hypothetical protein
LCIKLVIYKDYSVMRGQQNIKYIVYLEKQWRRKYKNIFLAFLWGYFDVANSA